MNEATAKAQKKLENIYTLEVEQMAVIEGLRRRIEQAKNANIDLDADDISALRQTVAMAQEKGQALEGELSAAQMVLLSIQKQRIKALRAVFAAELEGRMKEKAEIGEKLQKARTQVESLREKLEAAEKTCRMIDFQYSRIKTEEEVLGRNSSVSSLALYGEERLFCRDRQKYQEMLNDGRGGDYVTVDDDGEFVERQKSRNFDQWGYPKESVSIKYGEPAPAVDKPEAVKRETIVCEPHPA